MIRRTMFQNEKKRIAVTVDKYRGQLHMTLQEWNREADGCETMMLFGSWSPRVAQEPCARATDKAIARFYQTHLPAAEKLVEERVAFLTHGAA